MEILSDFEKAERNLEMCFKDWILEYSGRSPLQYSFTELTIAIDNRQTHWQEVATKKGLEWIDVSISIDWQNLANNVTVALGYENFYSLSVLAIMRKGRAAA